MQTKINNCLWNNKPLQAHLKLTFKLNVQAAELEFNALQSLAKSLVVMADRLLRSHTEWQREVSVSLLPVVVGAYRVHP